jgi:O-succinylbenzoic acid--CoA ligase
MNSAHFENKKLENAFIKFKKDWDLENSFEIFTSGSTGKPKKIVISKNQMILSASKTIDFFSLKQDIKALVCLSLDTIAGKMMLARCFVGNWNIKLIEPRANPLENLNEIFDFAALVPMQLERILSETPEKISSIKTIIVGGAPVPKSLIKLLEKKKVTVYQTFGMTETISHIAICKIGFETESNYQTVNGVTVSCTNNGNLIIHYPEMFAEPLQTNDVVKINSPKKFEWLGRSDFMINSGGVKLNPEKIEQKLANLIPFSFFITGMDDDILGQKLSLVIENKMNFTPEKVRLQEVLEKYEIPKLYINVNKFDRTKSGKVDRLKTIQKLKSSDWKAII